MELADFEKWIEAVHNIFEIFEGRFDAYPISRRCIDEWHSKGSFNISNNNNDVKNLKRLREDLDYSVFGIDDANLRHRIDTQFKNLIEKLRSNHNCKNIVFGIAPYFFCWNFQRFKIYFRQNSNFDIDQYFQNLGDFFANIKNKLRNFSERKIYSCEIDDKEIKEIFNEINKKLKELGIGQNEPVGVAKLLHIFAPYYFPLIDNPIAEATGLKQKRRSLTVDKYIKWMKSLKNWIRDYDERKIKNIEKQYGESILKLIDEGFYVMSSVNLSLRIKLMGIEIGSYDE